MVPQAYGLYPSSDDLDAGIDSQLFIATKVNHLKMSGEYMHVGRDPESGVCPFTFCWSTKLIIIYLPEKILL